MTRYFVILPMLYDRVTSSKLHSQTHSAINLTVFLFLVYVTQGQRHVKAKPNLGWSPKIMAAGTPERAADARVKTRPLYCLHDNGHTCLRYMMHWVAVSVVSVTRMSRAPPKTVEMATSYFLSMAPRSPSRPMIPGITPVCL